MHLLFAYKTKETLRTIQIFNKWIDGIIQVKERNIYC